ncbi:ATP-dependent Clp protease proteolytic subunit [Tenacibaculum sp. SSH1-16]|uniref:Clp protease ClpP n=1 Tax=Tenacibaculum sp. SSH1-16 TaxID=3136667 RepID=UPI0032C469AE
MIIKTDKNLLIAYGDIWWGDGHYFVSHLSRLEAEYDNIEVRLYTPGGCVFDGDLIYNAINKSDNIEKLVIDGMAASMGAIIMVSHDNVEIVENGYVMIHAPSSGSYGNAKDKEAEAKLLRMMEKNFISKLMARTGKSRKFVEKWMDGSDHWLNAEECLELGLVSKIIPSIVKTARPIENPESMGNQEVYNMYASLLTYDFPTSKTEILNRNSNMKQPLITALGLVGFTAQSSDTAIIEAVQARITKAEAEKDDAEKKLKEYVKAQVKTVLDQHEGKTFEKEQRAVYENIGQTSGVDALMTVLGTASAKTQAPNVTSLIQNNGSDARADWDFDKWQKEDRKGLEAMAEKNPAQFNQLFNAKYNRD